MAETAPSAVAGKNFIRSHLLNMEPYTPILPFEILSKQMGLDPHEIVKLDANENPYGPPPEVLEALGSMQFPNIYPDPETRRLRAALSDLNDIPVENLLVGSIANLSALFVLIAWHVITEVHRNQYLLSEICLAGWLRCR